MYCSVWIQIGVLFIKGPNNLLSLILNLTLYLSSTVQLKTVPHFTLLRREPRRCNVQKCNSVKMEIFKLLTSTDKPNICNKRRFSKNDFPDVLDIWFVSTNIDIF